MTCSLVAVCLSLSLGEFDASRAAAIERDQAKENAAVNAKYGNKKSSELTPDERRQMIKDQADAEQKVLDKYGVSQKDWIRQQAARSREQSEQVRDAVKAIEEQEKKAAEKAQKGEAPQEIQIQRGISDDKPVVLEEKAGAAPAVEQGLPSDFQADQAAAEEADSFEKAYEKSAESGAAKATGGSGTGTGKKGKR